MSNKINEQMVLNYSNPANNYGSNNLRDIILVLHESGKEPETIYNVLNLIGVDKQRAYEAIEMYVPKKIEIKMEIKETSLTEKKAYAELDTADFEANEMWTRE